MIFKKNLTMYSYHYNHQGSVSVVTNMLGHVHQHLQYLPYGGIFVDHRTSSYSSTYTFSAKEKDSESGYTYFGARYYTDNIMMWLSVDPMSDERPSLTFPLTQHWQLRPAIFPWYRCRKQIQQPCSWQRSSRTLLPSNSSFQ